MTSMHIISIHSLVWRVIQVMFDTYILARPVQLYSLRFIMLDTATYNYMFDTD